MAEFLIYGVVAATAAAMKVQLPGITGTMSVSYIFVLASVVHLTPGQVVCVAVMASLVQVFWQAAKRPTLAQALFNPSSMAVSAWVSSLSYEACPASLSLIFRMAIAGMTYFLVNTLSISGIVAMTECKRIITVWRTCYFWSFPYYLVGASLATLISFVSRYVVWPVALGVMPVVFIIYRSYRLYLTQLQTEKQHAEAMAALHLRTIEALALAIEAKDHTTGTHLRRVQVYARGIADELKLSEDEKQALQAASILHDIGKLAVPDYIISKPGKLTPEEFEKMKIHPIVGAEILERIDFPYAVVPVVRAHHEKWDGSGYPYGLRGEEIPIGARILSAVDCLDALATDRQYRKALPLDEALELVKTESGKAYDPRVVEILARRCRELERLASSQPATEIGKLSTGIKVERGPAPDAGFEAEPPSSQSRAVGGDFLFAIAGAREEAQRVFEFTQALGNTLSLADTLTFVSSRIKVLVPYDAIAIYILDGEELVPAYTNGENAKLFASLRIPLGQGLTGWVAENRKPIINGNPSVEPGYLNDPERFSTLRSALAVPLETFDGLVGVLALYAADKDAFARDHLRILLAINSKISLSIHNSLSYQHAQSRAVTDGVTNLPNASALFLRLESETARCRRNSTGLTVLVCDLDGFKQVNDQLGHLAGNKVLQAVSEGFRSHCREYDYVARMGGDEFVMLLPGIGPDAVAERLKALEQVVMDAGRSVCGAEIVSGSIGAANYPDDGTDAEQLLSTADQRMYRLKHGRKREARSLALLNLSQAVASSEPVREEAAE